jgi:type I restriction enzyme S subunit
MTAKRVKRSNVPNLRFPGFEEDWQATRFSNVVDFKITNSFSRENLNYLNGTVKNIHYGDIHTKFPTLFDITREKLPYINHNLSIGRILEDNYCQEGDIVFADASEDLNDVGKSIEIVNLNNEKVLSGLHTLLARPGKNIFYKGFVGYLLKSNKIRTQIQKESQGSKVLSISIGRISNIELFLTSIPEQQRIAGFLSIIDQRIQTQNKIIQRLETLINELRERLFAKKLKFKNDSGENFPAWKSEKLGGVTFKVDKKNKYRENLPVYSVSNVNGFVPQSEQFDNIDSNDRGYDISLYKIVAAQTFVYNPARINVGSIAYSGDLKRTIVSSLYVCFKTAPSLDDNFFKHFLQTEYFKNEVLKKGEGGVRIYLFYENFAQITISLPCYEEQVCISNFLLSLTEKINLEKLTLEKYYVQKKHLLANLFI